MKTQEEIEKLAELYVWGGIYLTETEKQQTEIAYMSGYKQCQEDMANKIKEAYKQGLLEEYACMPSINLLNKQDNE
jgi:hypothetical protein